MQTLEKIIVIAHFESSGNVAYPDAIETYKINSFAIDLQKITNYEVEVLASDQVTFQENAFYIVFTHSLYYLTQSFDHLNAKDRLNLTQRMFLFPATGKKPKSFGNDLFAGHLHLSYYELCSKYTQVMPFTERNNHFYFWGIPEIIESLKQHYALQEVEVVQAENHYALWPFQVDIVFEIGLYIRDYINLFEDVKLLEHWSKKTSTR